MATEQSYEGSQTGYNEPDNAGVVALPPVILLVLFLAGLALHLAFSMRFLPEGWVQLAIGVPLIGLAGALVSWAARTMTRAGTDISTATPTTAITMDGPYGLSRNPMYLAMATLYAGLAIAINGVLIIVLLPVLLGILSVGVIAREERYLERKFGEEYLRYKARVRRWL